MSTVAKEYKAKMNKAGKGKYSTRNYNRCNICGRSGAYFRQFGVCRICLRKLSFNGEIPGVTKATW
ncbi:type Z 30S ribosomal protein S14 [bacterium]|nr:MAG: type Z 30S ribosomal protein S14 [bacterium]